MRNDTRATSLYGNMRAAYLYRLQDRYGSTSNPGEALCSDAIMQVIHARVTHYPHHGIPTSNTRAWTNRAMLYNSIQHAQTLLYHHPTLHSFPSTSSILFILLDANQDIVLIRTHALPLRNFFTTDSTQPSR